MLAQAGVHDLEFDAMMDAAEQLRLGDLRNFRPIEQSDLKLLEELDFGQYAPSNDVWHECDVKPELSSLRRSVAETRQIDWLRNGFGKQPAPPTTCEPTLMELNVSLNTESMFTASLPPCPEVDEELLLTLDDMVPQDGRFCVPFRANYSTSCPAPTAAPMSYVQMQPATSFGNFCKTEPCTFAFPPSASTLRALLETREPADSDSQSETEVAVGPREPRGRAWSMDTTASGQSTATSGVFELSRSWTSQSSADAPSSTTLCDTPSGRSRNLSTDSNCSSLLSGTSSDAVGSSSRRRTLSSKRSSARAAGADPLGGHKTKSGCFWYQRDVKARSNLLPVPKLTDRAYETDYDQPNPKRLMQLGSEIGKISEVLQAVPQPSSVSDDDDKLNTKREKNKFASRVCRLKKKARYEANKIKLLGLKLELSQVKSVMAEARQLMSDANRGDKQQMALLARRLREVARARLGLMVAGSQTEYVNLVLDVAQRPSSAAHAHPRAREDSAGTPMRERLLNATAADNPELRSLAMKHTMPTYAEYFMA